MSHMVVQELIIKDLDLLEKICRKLGFDFQKNKKTAQYYGGNTKKCDHAIKVPGTNNEIALIKQSDGSYRMEADFYGTEGKTVKEAVGKITQQYAIEETKKAVRKKGYSILEQWLEDGSCDMQILID